MMEPNSAVQISATISATPWSLGGGIAPLAPI
jgi:hypothetical protein